MVRRRLAGQIFDELVARLAARDKLFVDGWGEPAIIERMLAGRWYPSPGARVAVDWGPARRVDGGDVALRDGVFESPLADLPIGVRTVRLRRARPAHGTVTARLVLIAGSREEGFEMRRRIFGPLVSEGVELTMIENPFYGTRRRATQPTASVLTVSDHLLLNHAIVAEVLAVVGGLLDEADGGGTARIGVAGYSMGGFMAALVAALVERPIAVAALAAGVSPARTFTRTAYAQSVDWQVLGATHENPRDRLWQIFECGACPGAPTSPEAAVILGCRRDRFVPPSQAEKLHALWPGSELRWLDAGHVSAVLGHAEALRGAARDALGRLR